jgi:lactoylglutathione lyase
MIELWPNQQKEPHMKFLHAMIRVGDLDQSLDFFCAGLGLREVRRTQNEKGRYTLVYLAAPEDAAEAREKDAPLVELTYNWDEHDYAGGRNFGHLAFAVENIYEVCARLQAAGVTINRPPRDGHMAFVRTPDMISIELLQKGAPLPPTDPWASAPNVGSW